MIKINNYTVCAFVAAILAILAWPQVSSAQANVTIVPSPYGTTTPVADAADKFVPIAGDAKWDHEVCVIAYRYAYELEALPERIAARLKEFDENTAGRMARGMSREENTRARAEKVDSLADDERAFRTKAATNMRNLPKCKGTFYRPAIEAQCRKLDRTHNRFCAILDGKELDGVRLTSDLASFRKDLAWNFIGAIRDRADVTALSGWSVGALGPDSKAHHSYDEIMDRLEADTWTPEDALDQLDSRLKNEASYVMSHSTWRDEKTGVPAKYQFGAWALSFGFVRGGDEGTEAAARADIAERTRAAGLFPTVGPYLQYPQLHFQAFLYDVLLEGDTMALTVVDADGSRHRLSAPAALASNPSGVPTLRSSFPSYLSHAFMIPTAADWEVLLSSQARQLIIEARMMSDQGTIEPVAYPIALGGLADALADLHAKHLNFDAEYKESMGLIGVHYEEPACDEHM